MNETMGLLLFVLVLSSILGFELIRKVPSILHTPLMSGANAIAGITLVGALMAAGTFTTSESGLITALGFLSVLLATINVVGGYLVTARILSMFSKKKKEK